MKLVCMGDSLTEGYNVDKKYRWSELVQKELEIKVVNSGISGDTTGGMLGRFKYNVIDHNPTHVIIMGGTNDTYLGVSEDIILANIFAMAMQAKNKNIEVIIGLPTKSYLPHNEFGLWEDKEPKEANSKIDAYIEKLREFTKAHNLKVIDFGYDVTAEKFTSDRLHPNKKGHKTMANNTIELLSTLK